MFRIFLIKSIQNVGEIYCLFLTEKFKESLKIPERSSEAVGQRQTDNRKKKKEKRKKDKNTNDDL